MTTKQDLINALVSKENVSKAQARQCVDAILETISDSLRAKSPVRLSDIGTLAIVQRKAKTAFNISKHEPMAIGPRTVIKFVPCRHFKSL